jgi:hypothetical protein
MTEYEIAVEGCPFRPRYRSEWLGCVVATAFKVKVLDPIAAAARFTRSVELTIRAVDDPYMGGFGMGINRRGNVALDLIQAALEGLLAVTEGADAVSKNIIYLDVRTLRRGGCEWPGREPGMARAFETISTRTKN